MNKLMKFSAWFFLLLFFNRAQAIEAFVQPVIFYTENQKAYTEIRIFISNKGFTRFIHRDSSYSYTANITLLLKRGTDILLAEKIVLSSPPNRQPMPLIHQLRWPLDGLDCELETIIEDAQNPKNELTLINKLNLNSYTVPNISGIQLLTGVRSSFDSTHVLFKNGFYSEPLIYHHLQEGQNILNAYFETYQTEKLGENYILKFVITKKDSANNYNIKEEWFKKRKTIKTDPQLIKHDISTYTSGSYRFSVQILDKKSKVLNFQSIEFTRENGFWDRIDELVKLRKEDKIYFDNLSDTLVDYAIRSMYPLISSLDASVLNELFRKKRLEEKRIFLFAFWSERSDSLGRDARTNFEEHLDYVAKVNELFYSGFGYGFETDRGVIYMKYGIPNEVISEDKDNGAFPYEIWKFNKLNNTGQTNVKFLFYNPDLAGSDFRLLHSTAHGERQNKRWEIELYRNAPNEIKGNNYLDANEMQPNFNRRAREYFKY